MTEEVKNEDGVRSAQHAVNGVLLGQLEYFPIYIMADSTIYCGQHNEFFSHHDIGDGQCTCITARRGTLFTLDGVHSAWCNICHQNVVPKED